MIGGRLLRGSCAVALMVCASRADVRAQQDTTTRVANPDTTRIVAGQDTAATSTIVPTDTTRLPVSCDGKMISEILVIRQPPTILSKVKPAWIRPAVAVAIQHRNTKADAITPFLQVRQGEECSDFRLAESARVLRAQPYLADAEVHAFPDDSGGVLVEVTTVDEVPLVLNVGASHGEISRFTYGNSNIMGDGLYAALEWRQGFAYRNGYGARFANYHAFHGPNAATVVLERFPLSSNYAAALAHPFYTQFQRMGWYGGVRRSFDYVSFIRPQDLTLSLGTTRTQWDLGGVFRVGGGRGHLFAGPLISQQRITTDQTARIITDSGFVMNPDSLLDGRYPTQDETRLSAVVGMRFLKYLKAYGFDALVGPQDMGKGIQLAALVGRGVGAGDHGLFASSDLYMGVGSETSFLALRTQWETQRRPDLGYWGDVVGSGRLAWYYKPSESGTWITSLEMSGGWRERTPFQLTLGDRQGGLRGYHGARIAGARRLVLRLERRWVLGSITRFDNIGIAAFGDAGKMWAGNVPYGVNSDMKASVGLSLLAAVPKQSRRLMRIDFAMPVVRTPHTGFQVRAGITTPLLGLWREPRDVARARSLALSSDVFTWP
ncbi:MAG TPA: hypothetical protein VIR34_15900 [Gemmatimonadaceae bacterium]